MEHAGEDLALIGTIWIYEAGYRTSDDGGWYHISEGN
jgi:hypothetical protein